MPDIFEFGTARPTFNCNNFLGNFVLKCAGGVVERTENVDGILFSRGDNLVFDVLVYCAEMVMMLGQGRTLALGEFTSQLYT